MEFWRHNGTLGPWRWKQGSCDRYGGLVSLNTAGKQFPVSALRRHTSIERRRCLIASCRSGSNSKLPPAHGTNQAPGARRTFHSATFFAAPFHSAVDSHFLPDEARSCSFATTTMDHEPAEARDDDRRRTPRRDRRDPRARPRPPSCPEVQSTICRPWRQFRRLTAPPKRSC